jgi:hypothetical protein
MALGTCRKIPPPAQNLTRHHWLAEIGDRGVAGGSGGDMTAAERIAAALDRSRRSGAVARAGVGGTQVRGEQLPDTTEGHAGPAPAVTGTQGAAQWSGSVVIGDIRLISWRREPQITPRGVIGVAYVDIPRRGICHCRLRSYRGQVRLEWAGRGLSVQWREVNPRFAWAVVELITFVDPEVRADDGSVPFIPSLAWDAPRPAF